MKVSFFIITLLCSEFVFRQDSLDRVISNDVCNCINVAKKVTEEYLETCFQKALEKNKDLVLSTLTPQDTSYENGEKIGKELFERISIKMIQNCDSYFTFFDSLRYSAFENLNRDSTIAAIKSINQTDIGSRGKDFFTDRGLLYFQLSDLENALEDFNKAISLDKNAFQSIYFKAWTFERKGNYKEAASLYTQLAEVTNKRELKIMIAIANRKRMDFKK